MRKNISNKGDRLASTICAVVVVAIMALVVVGVIALMRLMDGEGGLFVNGFFLLYILAGVAVAVGVLVALWLRFREVKKGEEAEAKKY